MMHPKITEALELLALAEQIGTEDEIAQANADLNRIVEKVEWTLAHQHCDHAYGICQSA